MRENGFVCCLIERREENFYVGPKYFSARPTQNFSLHNREKTRWREFDGEMTKLPICTPVAFFFFFSFFL